MMKRNLILVLIISIILFALPFSACAETKTGTCGTNLTWTLTDAGLLTVVGTGAMNDYSEDIENTAPWDKTAITEVVISSGVTSVGNYAFQACPNLTSVSFPNTLESIGAYAFDFCANLSAVQFPASLNTIDVYAFSNCSGLTEIVIPENVTAINEGAFSYCEGLISATVYAQVEVIPYMSFGNCTNLKSLTLPESLRTIAWSSCMGCYSLDNLILPEGLETIGDYAFYNSIFLSKVVIPASVTGIYDSAFDLPNGRDYLYIYCFSGSAAEDFADNNGYDKVLLDELIVQPTFILPVDTDTIEANAFENDERITAVNAENCTYVGTEAFKGCTALKQIRLPKDCTIIDGAFSGCGKVYVIAPRGGDTSEFCYFDENLVFVDEDLFSRLFPN